VIAGWTEGVQMMVEGKSAEFWIPPGYSRYSTAKPGRPQGMHGGSTSRLLRIVS
jgi:FKBP-type peptidyl-prolyl cis-trans isomerase